MPVGAAQPRLTRSGCRGAASSRRVVIVRCFPRKTPLIRAIFISRATWSRPMSWPPRRAACHSFRAHRRPMFCHNDRSWLAIRLVESDLGQRRLAAGVVDGRRDRDPGLGQDRTDRLDAEPLPLGVDVVHDHLSRRSSSAWAKTRRWS